MLGRDYIYDVKLCLVPYIMGDQWVEVKTSHYNEIVSNVKSKIFQKSRSHLKIPEARKVTRCKFHTEHPQILVATVKN